MKKPLCLLYLLLLGAAAFSQRGFMGKINEVSFDGFEAVFQKQYGFDYKFCPFHNFGFNFTYKINSGKDNFRVRDEYDDLSSKQGKYALKGAIWGAGIIYSSPAHNMPLPLGYYMGMVYEGSKNTLEEQYPDSAAAHEFETKGNMIKWVFGKNTYLFEFITFEFGLEMGMRWGKVYSLTYPELKPHSVYPADFPIDFNPYDTSLVPRYGTDGEVTHHKFMRLHLMPKIKIGYMF